MIDVNKIEAGTYELVVDEWDQYLSKPGEPFDFIRHRKGAEVELDVEDARRLVVAGAVVPASSKPTPIREILAEVGEDPEKAQAALDAENATAKPRPTLVEKLQAVVDAGKS